MKIGPPMLNGNLRIMCKKIVPVALLIIGMLVFFDGRAQVYSCRFSYAEKATSDYSSLLSSGNVKQKRHDALSHAGVMHVTALNDSVSHVKMMTDSFSTTMTGISMPAELYFNAFTDKHHRVYKVSTAANNKVFFSLLQTWLGDIHFKCPAPGIATEAKPDGDMAIRYSVVVKDGDAISLVKDNATYIIKPGSKQVIVLNAYKWEAAFNKQDRWPQEARFSEQKKQIMGRKVLACIQRELAINSISAHVRETVDTNGYQAVYLYPRLTEKERRERMAASLLGQETLATLSGKLQQVDGLTNERQFRLKSALRSLIITDSTVITALQQLPVAKQENSTAFEIIENAIIESRTVAGDRYISRALEKNEKNYERLKDLLIKISLAETFTNVTARQLLTLLHKNIDADTRSMVSLALSNYALSVRQDTVFYNQIIEDILSPYKNGISDTLQYIYLAGNAGIASETERLIHIAGHTRYRDEAIFALRNINNPSADAAVQSYLLAYRGSEDVFGSLLAKRDLPKIFLSGLEKNIITADARKDSTALPAIRYVLDNAWQRNIDVKKLLSHRFQMEAYKQEVEDFIRQSMLCH
jgi:hypothetical protein